MQQRIYEIDEEGHRKHANNNHFAPPCLSHKKEVPELVKDHSRASYYDSIVNKVKFK